MGSEYDGWKVCCDHPGCASQVRRDTRTSAERDADWAGWCEDLRTGRWTCPDHTRVTLATADTLGPTVCPPWIDGGDGGGRSEVVQVREDDGEQ